MGFCHCLTVSISTSHILQATRRGEHHLINFESKAKESVTS